MVAIKTGLGQNLALLIVGMSHMGAYRIAYRRIEACIILPHIFRTHANQHFDAFAGDTDNRCVSEGQGACQAEHFQCTLVRVVEVYAQQSAMY